MKLMHKYKTFILLVVLLSIVGFDAYAQKTFNNSIKLHTASFSIPKFKFGDITALLGGSFERKLSKNFSVGVGYFQWRPDIRGRSKKQIAEYPYESDTTRGSIIERIGYAMIDMSALYCYNVYRQKHFIKAGAGISYTWGTNMCVDYRYYNVYHGGWDGPNYFDKVSYLGIVPQLSYDYIFLKSRMNVGADVRGRYYLHVPNHQYDIGIHVGVNF